MLIIPLMALPGRDGNCSGTGEARSDTGALLAPRAISFSERKLAFIKQMLMQGYSIEVF